MSEVTSNLGVRIETGDAARDLLALQKGLEGAALGVAKLGHEIQNHAGNIQRVLGELSKYGFGGLSQSLATETQKVGSGMRALEREIEAAATRGGTKAGQALGDGIKKGVAASLTEAESAVSGATSRMAIAARELSQLSGVNPKRSVTGMPAKDTLLAEMLREEQEVMAFRQRMSDQMLAEMATSEAKQKAFREGITNQKIAELASEEAKQKAFREGITNQKIAELAASEAKQKAFREGITAQKLAEIASEEAKIKAFREGITNQKIAELAASEAKQKAFREGITAQKLTEIASDEAKQKAFREGITNQKIAEIASSEAKQRAFRESITNQRLAEIAADEAKQKAFREGITAQKLAEIASDEARQKAFREGILTQKLAELAESEAKQKAFREGILSQKLSELAREEAQLKAFREGILNQRLAELAESEAKQKAFREGILTQKLAEIDREERMLAARRAQYVGRTGTLGGFATALNTAPINMVRDANEAAAALDRQRASALNLTPAIDGSRASMKRWSDETKIAHDAARGAAAGIGYLWMTWGNIGAMAAGFAAVRGGISAFSEMAEVEVLLTKASREAGVELAAMQDHMMSLYTNGVMPMMTGPKEMAQQLKDLVYAGFTAAESFDMLGVSLKFAAVGELEASEAAQVLQQTIHAFNLESNDAGRVADVMAKAAAASATDVGAMASAMRQAVTVGALYNASVEDTATSLAVLAKAGIEGSAAGTSLKRFMDELASPKTNKAKEAIQALGIEVFKMEDGVKKLKPLAGIVDEMRDKFQTLSKVDAQAFFDLVDRMQDERGKKFFSLAVKMDQTEWDQFKETIEKDSAGFVDTLYNALSQTTKGLFQQTGAQLKASAQVALKEMDGPIKELAQSLLTFVTSAGFKEFLADSVGLMSMLVRGTIEYGKTIATVVIAYKSFQLASSVTASLISVTANLTNKMRDLGRAVNIVAAGKGGLLMGVRGLASVLPVVGGLLAAGATLWSIWGNSAEAAGRQARAGLDGGKESAAEVMRRLKELKIYGDGDLGTLRKREEELERNIQLYARSSGGSAGAAEKLKTARAELIEVQNTIEDLLKKQRALANVKVEPVTPGNSDFKGIPDGTQKSTSPLAVADFQRDIKLYSAVLQEINKIEQAALNRSKAIWQAGLGTEESYLRDRNEARMRADAEAKTALEAYVKAQEDVAAAAESEYFKQIKEARQLGLMNDEATLNKIRTAANAIQEAYAKAAQAREAYDNRAQERADGQGMDTLASLKDKFGNPDEAVRKAQEYNAQLDQQIERVKGVSKVTEDKNILSMEGSMRSIEGLIAEAEATQALTGVTNAQIEALKEKRDTLQSQLGEYRVSNVESYLAKQEGIPANKVDAEIARAREQAEQMRAVIMETTERTELEKRDLLVRLTNETNEQIRELENQRMQTQLGSASNLFAGLAGIAKAMKGEMSKEYRALFAISKAFNIAQASMELSSAVVKALNSGPFPANLAAMGTVMAAGTGLISAISSSNFSGAYDAGGDIPLGRFGLVGERGPEWVEGPARVTSRVETARMMGGGGAAAAPAAPPVVNVRNINVLDPSVVGDYLGSDDGEQLIMNVVQRNQRSLGY